MKQLEILNRIIWDEKYFKREEILLGILERDGKINYIEFQKYELKEGWLWKEGLPQIPLHRVVEIKTKDGRIVWRSPKYPGRRKLQIEHEEHH